MMSVWDMLGKTIIGPLELLLDVIYTFSYRLTHKPGMAIVVLSLTVNLLILPLYLRADKIQEEDKDQMIRMKPGIDRIKKAFRGDEQYLILQTYYRQNHYKPYYALKSLLPLLLQVPFFMAAYNYLSNLDLLDAATFGPIRDLGAADALLKMGSLAINVLPVTMTVINLLSGLVYSKGMPLKSKVQMLVIALVFLILLYDSPSGLVLYWTLNNVFSLAKNLFLKLKNHKIILKGCCSAAGIVLPVYFFFFRPVNDSVRIVLLIAAAVLLQLPLLIVVLRQKKVLKESFRGISYTKTTKIIFWAACVFLALLTGCLIPSEVLKSSPGEFIDVMNYRNPLWYILHSFLLAAGSFLLWSPVFYNLSPEKWKGTFSLVFAVLALTAAINFSVFGGDYGDMSSLLVYDNPLSVKTGPILIGSLIIPMITLILLLIIRKKPGMLMAICIAGCIAVGANSVMNAANIQAKAEEIRVISESAAEEMPSFRLSRKGKNVVVIMMDRAISGFVPYIMNEKPELLEKYDGFTYYPNTISFGAHTNVGSPPLFGGYEYTPDMMSVRADEKLVDKNNEALSVMPVMFDEAGYDVTVFDPPIANYNWASDVSIYDEYPGVNGYLALGKIRDEELEEELSEITETIRKRNLFCYSIFRAAPPVFQKILYNEGEFFTSIVKKSGLNNTEFVDSYSLLKNLPAITEIVDESENGCFVMMENNVTHGGEILQEPDYVLKPSVDNREYEKEYGIRTTADGQSLNIGAASVMIQEHYHGNMSGLLLVGDWLDYLRENGAYDNTKIIIVADHGYHLGLFGFDLSQNYSELPKNWGRYETFWTDTMCYNPLLMVKDYNATGFRTDDTFMTNADTLSIAAEGAIENPINPFTDKPITMEAKQADEMHIVMSDWHTELNNGNVYMVPMHITLRNHDIFNEGNWTIENAVPRKTEE